MVEIAQFIYLRLFIIMYVTIKSNRTRTFLIIVCIQKNGFSVYNYTTHVYIILIYLCTYNLRPFRICMFTRWISITKRMVLKYWKLSSRSPGWWQCSIIYLSIYTYITVYRSRQKARRIIIIIRICVNSCVDET